MSKYYKGSADNQGVHTNSGIPNRAFVLAAKALGGNSWDKAGRIWYETMVHLIRTHDGFVDMRKKTIMAASSLYGSAETAAVKAAWQAVGL